MKAQTRIGSLIEAGQNIVIGYGISVVSTYTLGPHFHMHPSVGDVLGFGLAMTVVSVVRQYVIRRWHEWRRGRFTPPDFQYIMEEVAAERHRQISGEGFSLAHDDRLPAGFLAWAAATYAYSGGCEDGFRSPAALGMIGDLWPGRPEKFKPVDPRRDLVKSAALSVAAIGSYDRRQKAAA